MLMIFILLYVNGRTASRIERQSSISAIFFNCIISNKQSAEAPRIYLIALFGRIGQFKCETKVTASLLFKHAETIQLNFTYYIDKRVSTGSTRLR